jgi:hypothetical protein
MNELEWLLKVDIRTSIEHLSQILADCAVAIVSNNTPTQYSLSSQGQLESIKANATIEGNRITNADVNVKLSSKHPVPVLKTCIQETPNNPFCWRLYQIQDASNHLNNAIDLLKVFVPDLLKTDNEAGHAQADFELAEEMLQLINNVMNSLQKSRSSLLAPKKSSVEELQHCQNMQSISPALPLDYTISFYIQANNLVCSVYHLSQSNNRAQVKNEYQAEVSIPFLSDVLVSLGLALQVCQQMLDKIQTLQNVQN